VLHRLDRGVLSPRIDVAPIFVRQSGHEIVERLIGEQRGLHDRWRQRPALCRHVLLLAETDQLVGGVDPRAHHLDDTLHLPPRETAASGSEVRYVAAGPRNDIDSASISNEKPGRSKLAKMCGGCPFQLERRPV
jgi:hypothetical protein